MASHLRDVEGDEGGCKADAEASDGATSHHGHKGACGGGQQGTEQEGGSISQEGILPAQAVCQRAAAQTADGCASQQTADHLQCVQHFF